MKEGVPIKLTSPWAVEPGSSVDVLALAQKKEKQEKEFVQKILEAFCGQLTELAAKDGSTYEIEEKKNGILLTADREQFSQFLKHVNTLLHESNELVQEQGKTFRLHASMKGMHSVLLHTEIFL